MQVEEYIVADFASQEMLFKDVTWVLVVWLRFFVWNVTIITII